VKVGVSLFGRLVEPLGFDSLWKKLPVPAMKKPPVPPLPGA